MPKTPTANRLHSYLSTLISLLYELHHEPSVQNEAIRQELKLMALDDIAVLAVDLIGLQSMLAVYVARTLLDAIHARQKQPLEITQGEVH